MTRLVVFLTDDTGAVTVDWVVLTAAVVGLGFLVSLYIASPVSALAEWIGYTVEYGSADAGGRKGDGGGGGKQCLDPAQC